MLSREVHRPSRRWSSRRVALFSQRDKVSLDLPFYVTAHEVAHQWWAHQVIAGNVEGATSIVETLAQYSALMVMKHHYGPQSIRKFLRFELDGYLRGRAQERNEEEPLYKVDVNQGYIHYNKGALVMYAIQDYIGEDKVSQALTEFTKAYAFKGPPYSVSLDLIAYLKQYSPPEYQYLYEDLWKNITLYVSRAGGLRAALPVTLPPDGEWFVRVRTIHDAIVAQSPCGDAWAKRPVAANVDATNESHNQEENLNSSLAAV